MSNRADKHPSNAEGKFYVDSTCDVTNCGYCVRAAPKNFVSDGFKAFCFNQPSTPEQLGECGEAMSECTLKSIGCDGLVPLDNAPVQQPEPPTEEMQP